MFIFKFIKYFYIFYLLLSASLFAFPLKDPKGNFEWDRFEEKVPLRYEDLSNLKFPLTKDIELDVSTLAEGAGQGPDGGDVYKWKNGSYKWNLKRGGEIAFWTPSNWILSLDQFTFHTHGDKDNKSELNFRLTYPNGSILSRVFKNQFNNYFYYFEDYRNHYYFQLFPNNLFTTKIKKSGRFVFYFEPEHEAWIDAFTDGDAYARFENYLSRNGYTSSNIIPVIFFKNKLDYGNFHNVPNLDCAGGKGGIFGLSFCNSKPLLSYVGTNKEIMEKAKNIHHTHMIYHEWGHHVQQTQCAMIRKDKSFPNQKFSAWFNEGMAEYLGYIGSSKKRGNDRILFFERYVLTGKEPQLSKDDPYLLGGQLFRYIAENYDEKTVLDLWTKSCKGENENEIFKSITSFSAQELLNKLYNDLAKFRNSPAANDFMKTTLADWAMDIYTLNFIDEESKLPITGDTASKPNLKSAFELDIRDIEGKLEGQFTTPRKEQVYLFLDGTYTIKGPNYTATFFKNQTIVYILNGLEITQWPNGNTTEKKSLEK
ncbi:MAG: hypothetical protein O9264_15160 [Leptospira sp.]|nr:hypothetical protein [Leptospira sp.]